MRLLFVLLIGCHASVGGVDFSTHDMAVPADLAQHHDLATPLRHDLADPINMNLWPPSYGPIRYFGGPVVTGTANIYIIWYGSWSTSDMDYISTFVQNLDASAYASVWGMYAQTDADGGMDRAADRVSLAGQITVGYSLGMTLGDGDILAVINAAIEGGAFPRDPYGIYFVLTSADVSQGFFCRFYCGWHNSAIDATAFDLRYGFVGDPNQCPDACTIRTRSMALGAMSSPSGNWGVDGLLSVLTHEISEAVTDPDPLDHPAWKNLDDFENGDMCVWRFEPVYRTVSGAFANVQFGGVDYLIQQTWVPGTPGRCDLHP